MHHKIIKTLLFLFFVSSITACNGFFEKDNTPAPTALVKFTPEIHPRVLWSTQAGQGVGDDYLKMGLGLGCQRIYVTSTKGIVTALDKTTGKRIWQVDSRLAITTAPTVANDVMVVGTNKGEVAALSQINGSQIWKTNFPGEILAKPAISGQIVVVKSTNGNVRALSLLDGSEIWSFQQVEPTLILRGSSAPLIRDNQVIVGFANGNLAKLQLNTGQLAWLQTIAVPYGAFAIQRMVDINADPILYEHDIYAATYQGKIASLNWASGRIQWSHDLSSYTGMTADDHAVYISDAGSHLWSFDTSNGTVNWQQGHLQARGITGPASIRHYLVVGDNEGFVHWLSKQDGHFVARTNVGSPIYAAPVVENNVIYLLSAKGYVTAYTIE